MRITPEFSSCRIVLFGKFKPEIFAPHWLEGCGIFTSDQADDAEIETVQHDYTSFKMDWLKLTVDQRRFTVEARQLPYGRLGDFALQIFNSFLPTTPIGAFDINRVVHFDAGSPESRERILDLLAPKAAWGEWSNDLEGEHGSESGGMFSLEMIQKDVSDRPFGYVRARVQPSSQLNEGKTGIYIEVNDHFEVENAVQVDDCVSAMTLLKDSMDDALKRSEWIIDQVMALK